MTSWETPMTDPALDFWLRHVAAEGGLHEPAGDATYVVLPPALSDRYRLPEELRVTADPDVARDDGVTLLALGHPVLSDAAERTLVTGDAGTLVLVGPTAVPPGPDVLLAAAREAFPVDHGRIDASGEPEVVRHGVVRVGALVTFELSAEDRFQEQAERWVDLPSRRLLPREVVDRLVRASADADAAAELAGDVRSAVAEAHRLIDAAVLARREALADEMSGAYQAERARAVAYYADAIAGLERRLATAPEDRKAALEQRLHSTREEEIRRLAEIAEKHAASHTIRPYRLHVIEVPALRLTADVRRGDRRYPMTFDWLLPAGAFAPVRCPSCGGEAPLVAGKQHLGCETCLPPRAEPAPKPSPRPAFTAKSEAPAGKTAVPGKAAPVVKSAPPPRKAVLPPRAKLRQKRKPPEKIAEELWIAVARGFSGNASRLLEPGSPAAMLYRVFGAPGLTQVVGMSPDVPPYSYSARKYQFGGSADLVSGTLTGMDESERRYFLSCRDDLIAEVLPCPVYRDGELWRTFWMWGNGDAAWTPGRLPPDADVDPVGRILLAVGPSWHGLAVAARSVAAWERIADAHQRVLHGRQPHVVAAAVDRLVGYRAGGRSTFADAAAVYRADEQAIRQADRVIRPLLALCPDRPW
jgi:hypothetical protein